MSLKDRITEDMKSAMRARAADRLSALRMLLAAIKQREVDERITLDDAQIASVVEKLAKQRRDSITQFEAGGRQDLADREKFELTVLLGYLPEQADASQVEAAIEAAIAATGAAGPQDMGKVMTQVRAALAGRADMAAVSAQVKSRLAR
ncbi:MAG: GatB/YqeY domain-containing protein [Betaproteobacteria bacterium]|nr:GatB/YqeY domain-containing protein [Betaproteobacteria bacterium]